MTLNNPVTKAFSPPLPLPSHILLHLRFCGFYKFIPFRKHCWVAIVVALTWASLKPGKSSSAPRPLIAIATSTKSFVAPRTFCTRSPHLMCVPCNMSANVMQRQLTKRVSAGGASKVGSTAWSTTEQAR